MTKFWIEHKKNIIFSLLAICVVACLMIANFLSGLILPSSSPSTDIYAESTNIYLLSLSKSKIRSESLERAKDFQEIGAGGYVWELDDYHHVITSAYSNKSDAVLVQSSIKLNQNLECELLSIKFESFKLNGNFDSDQIKVLDDLLSAPIKFYNSLYDIAISLDTSVYNETTAKLAVNTTQNNLATYIANFGTLFHSPLPEIVSPLKSMIDEIFACGQKLVSCENTSPKQTYSSMIKYCYLNVLNIYKNFVS